MKTATFERAIHKWDKWYESIERSRAKLGYNPKWNRKEAIEWIEKHYSEIAEQARAELVRLQLPSTVQKYWEDCFYSDYRDSQGNINLKKILRCLSEPKSLPDLPCSWGLIWYDNEDVHNPWLRVELKIDARFATKELYDFAATCAYPSILTFIEGHKIKPHEITEWLQGGRPTVDEQKAIECARLKYEEHLTYKEIGKLFSWPLQKDSYGDLNQCSTARRYVKLGKELLKRKNTNQ